LKSIGIALVAAYLGMDQRFREGMKLCAGSGAYTLDARYTFYVPLSLICFARHFKYPLLSGFSSSTISWLVEALGGLLGSPYNWQKVAGLS
jgi:uncharacterized membrane protein (GlpM family)